MSGEYSFVALQYMEGDWYVDKKILVMVSGLTCVLCSNKIEHKLKKLLE